MTWLLPPRLFLLCLPLMIGLHLFWPLGRLLPEELWPLGAVLAVSGLILAAIPARRFRRRAVNIKTFDIPTGLVTDGLFAFTRNPMYLGFVLSLTGIWVTLGTLTALAPALLFLMAAEHWYIPFEERRMAEEFGESYAAYRTRVRRWIGRKRG